VKIRNRGKNGGYSAVKIDSFPKMAREKYGLRDSYDSHIRIVSYDLKNPKRSRAFTCG
jgi:hypothetical protein